MSRAEIVGMVYTDTHVWKRMENHPSFQAEN